MGLWYNARNSAVKMVGGFTAGLRTGWSPIMRLKRVIIENYRAIERLDLPLHPQLTVLHGDNGHGKTSVLNAIAVGLSVIPKALHRPTRDVLRVLETDQRRSGRLRVTLTTTDGLSWQQGRNSARLPLVLREMIDEITTADEAGTKPLDLPILALYDTDRAVIQEPRHISGLGDPSSRYGALRNSFSGHTNFRPFFEWFYEKENHEIRQQRERRDFGHRLPDLDAVRKAIAVMVGGVSQPSIENRPRDGSERGRHRFVVSVSRKDGKSETLEIDQLSGGYRIMLALVADLARRMAQGNPHLDDPLQSEAIVLIDEVDLHLHPSWQQRVLPDLMRTFPNAQFIVSTHSPQVLTTVSPEHIVRLRRDGDGIAAAGTSGPTFGAEAGYALSTEMGVPERPPAKHNEFVDLLEKYNALVNDGRGKSEEALQLRQRLESLSPRDFALDRADSEMRRQNVMRRLAESKRTEETR